MIRIDQIKIEVSELSVRRLESEICRILHINHVPKYEIVKKSIDARKKPKLFYVYSVDGYGNAKEVYKAVVSSLEKVAPADMIVSADKKLMYCSSPDLRELYCALSSDNGTTTAVYFDPSSKLLSSLRYYGGENVTVVPVSR